MRKYLLIFLIVLLPLRGWAVDGMALEMGLTETAVSGVAHPEAGQSLHADCPMLSQATPVQDPFAPYANDHQGCQSCELCMPLAALEPQTSLLVSSPPNGVPATPAPAFASAVTARLCKPPIS